MHRFDNNTVPPGASNYHFAIDVPPGIEQSTHKVETWGTHNVRVKHYLRIEVIPLNADLIDGEKLLYRQDAWVNYTIGLSFETNQEWDNARISYQKSAELYEQAYQKQYQLSEEITFEIFGPLTL